MQIRFRPLAFLLLLAVSAAGNAAQVPTVNVDLGLSNVPLNGPWLFHLGDNPKWADPGLDDSGWDTLDLTPPPGATDGDVGLNGYVPGWTAKDKTGYSGYAWYRIHLAVKPRPGERLALLGPWAVDNDYQVYIDGALVGGVGDFSGDTPIANGDHYPTQFVLPPQPAGPLVIAIRVWVGPWDANAPGAGGIHIAPVIGTVAAIDAQYRLQWLKIFEGYAVDMVPALLFFLAALMALCLRPFEPGDRGYPWLAAALTLSGILRGNQAFFFWLQIETIQEFVFFILALGSSLSLAAWMMAWRGWFKLDKPAWLPKAIAALTIILFIAQLLGRPWMFHLSYPHALSTVIRYLITWVRYAFLLVFLATAYQGLRRQGREGAYALPAMLAIGTALFSTELVKLKVPGIWFPFGVGLSLSECASVACVLLLLALFLRRLWSYAARQNSTPANPRSRWFSSGR